MATTSSGVVVHGVMTVAHETEEWDWLCMKVDRVWLASGRTLTASLVGEMGTSALHGPGFGSKPGPGRAST